MNETFAETIAEGRRATPAFIDDVWEEHGDATSAVLVAPISGNEVFGDSSRAGESGVHPSTGECD